MDRQEERRRWRHEDLSGGGGSMSRRQDRFYHGGGGGDDGSGQAPGVEVVEQAECTARSCMAVSLADCVALGCCPCAVVSLLALALVKAPLAVGRRCVRRLRRRQHKKRVRDLDPVADKHAPAHGAVTHEYPGEDDDTAAASPGHRVSASAASSDAEKVWLEMFQLEQWGFGRLSISMNPATGRNTDGDDVRN